MSDLATIGVLSPGEIGSAVARSLTARGVRVCAALNGRSERTRSLATAAGVENVGSIDQLVRQCDAVLSTLTPSAAPVAAQQVAAAMDATGSRPLFVDCNTIAPEAARRAAEVIGAVGGGFLDGSIIRPGGGGQEALRIYVAGPGAQVLGTLAGGDLEVRILSDRIGDASALRMCYSAFTEGLTALAGQLLVAAERLGVVEALAAELERTRGAAFDWLVGGMPDLRSDAQRWSREMEEVAQAFAGVGLPPKAFQGVAEICRWVSDTPLGKDAPGARDPGLSGAEVVRRLAQA